MDINQYDYSLPPELIAQYPLANRLDSRLLRFDREAHSCLESPFADIESLLQPGDLLVVNDTRVLPARIMAAKPSGGRVEIMLERLLGASRALVQLRANKSVKNGQQLLVGELTLVVEGRQDRFFILRFPDRIDLASVFQSHGSMPLPPYIERQPDAADLERYQTVYSRHPGAVAAPTAGLHFDQGLIERLRNRGINWQTITLHVGAGTFLPVQTDNLDDHQMHAELVSVNQQVCDAIEATRAAGGRIIAVGTTVIRALEAAAQEGNLLPFQGDTRLFIKPGFQFRVVDMLITNFHLPRSTLLVLVATFAGYDQIMQMYHHAVDQKFRFFSYGDAMLVERYHEV